MHADLVLVLLVIVFGCAAFLFGLVYIVGSIVGMIGRGFWSFLRPTRRLGGGCGTRMRVAGGGVRGCSACGNVDPRTARYCARCGSKLSVNSSAPGAREGSSWWMG